MIIEDGTGSGYKQKINANNRAYVNAIQESDEQAAVQRGDAYNINTGEISLTSTSASGILYIKNNETQDLVIHSIAVGVSSGGTTNDSTRVQVIRNPTAGTLISGASSVGQNANRNFGSSKTLTVDAYKGAEGNTVTDGENIALVFMQSGSRLFATLNFELTKGDSIAVTVDSNTSSGTTAVYAAGVCYLKDANA